MLFSKIALNWLKVFYIVNKRFVFQVNAVFTTLIIRNVSWAPNQYIMMISEGSCDAEDEVIDAENSALASQ